MHGRQRLIPLPAGWSCVVDERASNGNEVAATGVDAEYRGDGFVVNVRAASGENAVKLIVMALDRARKAMGGS